MMPSDDTHFGGQDYILLDQYSGMRDEMDVDPLNVYEDERAIYKKEAEQRTVFKLLFWLFCLVAVVALAAGMVWMRR